MDGEHKCQALKEANIVRKHDGETNVFIFKDVATEKWDMRVMYEYVEIAFCPFCGEKLDG